MTEVETQYCFFRLIHLTHLQELFHYGTLTGVIMPQVSDMSLGSQDAGSDENTSLDQSLFETLNNVNYRTALGNVVSLAMSDVSVDECCT